MSKFGIKLGTKYDTSLVFVKFDIENNIGLDKYIFFFTQMINFGIGLTFHLRWVQYRKITKMKLIYMLPKK